MSVKRDREAMETKHNKANCFGWEDGCSFCIEERRKGTSNVTNLHTPGPWEVKFESDPRKDGHGLYHIWNVDDRNYEDQKANARLIAAAPELLREVKSMLLFIETYGNDVTSSFFAGGNGDAIKALIAKATGGK